jgi:hypothetical protein
VWGRRGGGRGSRLSQGRGEGKGPPTVKYPDDNHYGTQKLIEYNPKQAY